MKSLTIDDEFVAIRAALSLGGTHRSGALAFSTLLRIRVFGLDICRRSIPRATYYNHMRVLSHAGLLAPDEKPRRWCRKIDLSMEEKNA